MARTATDVIGAFAMKPKFKSLARFALLWALVLPAAPAQAALRVLACEPEWGALAQVLGGTLVEVSVATTALQDPHQIQARPSLIARARNADLLVCTGAELEVGWLPVLLQQSANARVQLTTAGSIARPNSPDEMRARVEADVAKWKRVAEYAKIQLN